MANSVNFGTEIEIVDAEPLTDPKGRPLLQDMTDREMLMETLAILRAGQDMVEKFMDDMAGNSQAAMMAKMMGINLR